MSAVTADRYTADRRDADHVHADHARGTQRSWAWALVEALAYAGAAVDPSAALAATRLARIREQELERR
jgi:hypothetical protein